MAEQKLKEALAKLEQSMAQIDAKDTEARQRLEQLISKLKAKINAPHQTQEHHQLLGALKEKILYFENAHPFISRTLEDVVEILAKMGI